MMYRSVKYLLKLKGKVNAEKLLSEALGQDYTKYATAL
jgi:hypothetical protein